MSVTLSVCLFEVKGLYRICMSVCLCSQGPIYVLLCTKHVKSCLKFVTCMSCLSVHVVSFLYNLSVLSVTYVCLSSSVMTVYLLCLIPCLTVCLSDLSDLAVCQFMYCLSVIVTNTMSLPTGESLIWGRLTLVCQYLS